MKIKIKRALISVHDKSKILELVLFLQKHEVEIISTGKTHELLKANNIKSINVSDYTGFPEILNGRVKTLHPKIFGGILASEDNFSHIKDKKDNNIQTIDLVVVNLYPFTEVATKKTSSENDIIDNIDIGGVSLVRAAAKNFHSICILTSTEQYATLMIETDLHYRQKLAKQAFALTSAYESNIYNWFCNQKILENNIITVSSKKLLEFRYGENPHQKSAFFGNGPLPFIKLQGKELSYNNILDLDVGILIVQEFEKTTVAIIKHNNPCGVSSHENVLHAYTDALSCDSISSFGGIVVSNSKITKDFAAEVVKTFVEVLAAPGIDEDAKIILTKKPNMRVLIYNKYENKYSFRTALGGILIQEENNVLLDNKHYDIVTKATPSKKDLDQLLFAWKVCKYVKSNAIVIVKDSKTVAIGAGQTSRIDSVKIALEKAGENAKGACLASDGFFPFADSIEAAHKADISAIIEPGGSIKDNDVIQEANRYGMHVLFTNIRHFRH